MGLRVFYGDLSFPRVFAIDVESMKRIVDPDIKINSPCYPVDKVDSHLLYGITRGENSVTPIDMRSNRAGSPIQLLHRPRSTATSGRGKSNLCLVAGADQPVVSIIDVNKSNVIQVVGKPTGETETDYGGSLASGHPTWINGDLFLLLDRVRKKLCLCRVGSSLPLYSVRTPTSLHHVEKYGTGYVALSEGNLEARIPPALVFFDITRGKNAKIAVSKVIFMPSVEGGAHHIGIVGDVIYVPTSNGIVFVLEPEKGHFKFRRAIKAGRGAGHVYFNPKSKTGVIVNHNDEFVTLFDQSSHTLISNVPVASLPPSGKKSQAHTSSISANGKYFYGSASQNGEFFRIDLAKKKKDKVLDLNTYGADAQPLQGVFVS